MGTAERRETAVEERSGQSTDGGRRDHGPLGQNDGAPGRHAARDAGGRAPAPAESDGERPALVRPGDQQGRPLWVEEPARRRRMPDPVRRASVRAVLIISVTLIQAMVAFLCTLAGSWLAFPMVLSSVVSTVVATWGALDVWVTRQVWNQRYGVVSVPSSTARALRRELRRSRRHARADERAKARIARRRGAGQLSHS